METGDAATMGQAWQAVKTGSVQTDIDSLNALLKYDFYLDTRCLVHPSASQQPCARNDSDT